MRFTAGEFSGKLQTSVWRNNPARERHWVVGGAGSDGHRPWNTDQVGITSRSGWARRLRPGEISHLCLNVGDF